MSYTYKQLLKNENNEYKFFEIDARKAESFKVPVGWFYPQQVDKGTFIDKIHLPYTIFDEDTKLSFKGQGLLRLDILGNKGLIIERNIDDYNYKRLEQMIIEVFKNQ